MLLDPVISVTRFKEVQRGLIILTESLPPSSEIPPVEKQIRLFGMRLYANSVVLVV